MVEAFWDGFVNKLQDIYELAQEREGFLNVEEELYHRLFYFILIVKCVFAGYGVKKAVPQNVTISILWLNFVNSCILDGKAEGLVFNFSFFVSTTATQFLFAHDRYPPICSAISWSISSMDKNFHFALDLYVIATVLSCIVIAHSKNIEEACLLLISLFFVNWACFQFIEAVELTQSLVLFYVPVFFVTSFSPFDQKHLRFACTAVWGFMWLFYRLVRAEFVTINGRNSLNVLKKKFDYFLGYIETLSV